MTPKTYYLILDLTFQQEKKLKKGPLRAAPKSFKEENFGAINRPVYDTFLKNCKLS